MTQFSRRGHYRTNANGTVSWVQGHTVSRNDWNTGYSISRGSNPPSQMQQHWYNGGSSENKSRPLDPMPLDIWSNRCLTHNALCPVCKQAVFFYRNEHGSAVFFDELGPPWSKHPCTAGDLPALFLGTAPQPALPPQQWQAFGWKPLRSVQIFAAKLGRYGITGYSGGVLLRFLLDKMPDSIAAEIQRSGQAIWHYHAASHSGELAQAGVYTPSDQFHLFSLESIDAQSYESLRVPIEYQKKETPLSDRFNPATAATFFSNRFLAQPNATCPVCKQGVYVYHAPTTGLLVLDEEGPPWSEHVCHAKKNPLSWKQVGWHRLVFSRFRHDEDSSISIVGYSKGQRVVLKLPHIDPLLVEKWTAAKAAYYHYHEHDYSGLVLGIYIPNEPFWQVQAVWSS